MLSRRQEIVFDDLRDISNLGPVKAVSNASNAVGKTLQKLLGITHSTTSKNYHKGILITSTATKRGRTNLFARVPDRDMSRYKSTTDLVRAVGRENKNKGYEKSLFCTVKANVPNSFGLSLKVDSYHKVVDEMFTDDSNMTSSVVCWSINDLESRISELGDTAIVTAIPSHRNGSKYFHYRYVEFLGAPNASKFGELLDNGIITLEHLISLKIGGASAIEKGPLFKISNASRNLLYPQDSKYDLME